jgi:cell division protein FtsW
MISRIKGLYSEIRSDQKACDFLVVILVLILAVFGIVMVFSASYYKSINETGSAYAYLKKQAGFVAAGCVLMWLFSRIDYHRYRKWAPILLVVGLIMLVLIFTPLGMRVNGARRWLNMGLFTVMPGELAKPILILFTAGVLSVNDSRRIKDKWKVWGMLIAIAIVFGVLIFQQPNLSTAITVVGIVGCMMLLSGFPLPLTGVVMGMGIISLALLGNTGTYWGDRISSFMDPFKDPVGDGFQAAQSLLALGTGGLRGLGLGKSVQKTLYLPEPQNDFILAIIGEELGLIRVLLLLTVFLILIWRCFLVAMHAKDKYGMYIASGITLMIGLQVVLNVAVVTSSMPPTGIALPFVGYGGNTIVIFLACMGILLNISRSSDLKPLIKPRPAESRVIKVKRKRENPV